MSLGMSGESDPWDWGYDENNGAPPAPAPVPPVSAQLSNPEPNNSWIQHHPPPLPPHHQQEHNYTYQHPYSKRENVQQQMQNSRSQSGAGYFESVDLLNRQQHDSSHSQQRPQPPQPPPTNHNYISQDFWGQHQQQQGRYNYEKANNNSGNAPPLQPMSDVENKEIAPPDKPPKTGLSGYNKPVVQDGYEEQNYRPSSGLMRHHPQPKQPLVPSHFNPQMASSPMAPAPPTPPQALHQQHPEGHNNLHQVHQQELVNRQQYPVEVAAEKCRTSPAPAQSESQNRPDRPPSVSAPPLDPYAPPFASASENFQFPPDVKHYNSSRTAPPSATHYQNYRSPEDAQFQNSQVPMRNFSQFHGDNPSSTAPQYQNNPNRYLQNAPPNPSNTPPPPPVGLYQQNKQRYSNSQAVAPPLSNQFHQNPQTPPPPMYQISQAPPQQQNLNQYSNSQTSSSAGQYQQNRPPSNSVPAPLLPQPAHHEPQPQFSNSPEILSNTQPPVDNSQPPPLQYEQQSVPLAPFPAGNSQSPPPPQSSGNRYDNFGNAEGAGYPGHYSAGVHQYQNQASLAPAPHQPYPTQQQPSLDNLPDNVSSARDVRERSSSPCYPGVNKNSGQETPQPPVVNAVVTDNQERIPENRERLDNTEVLQHQMSALSINQQQVESEIQHHCSVDRNQYLETGQLSNLNNTAAGSANIEIADEGDAPPPGLHRLVTGQGCENQEQIVENQMSATSYTQSEVANGSVQHDTTRHSTPLSSIGEPEHQARGTTARESDGERCENNRQDAEDTELPARLVPGQAHPPPARVVLGQNQLPSAPSVPSIPHQDSSSTRSNTGRERDRDRDRDRESDSRIERMVEGEPRNTKQPAQNAAQSHDDYNDYRHQPHRSRHRHRESSYEEDERDYSTDREKRHDEYRRRDDRHRRRREHRSPEYRSDEEYEDRRGYGRRESRRMYDRDYSPDYSYRRHRRPAEHYPREYDDYYYRGENRSRPSSRTGSDYRLSKSEYQRQSARHYYPEPNLATAGGHYSDFAMGQRSWKEYYENMRRNDPVRYTIWYNQYMMNRCSAQQSAAYSNDRGSVHSGQSSTNQRHHNITSANENVDEIEQVDDTLVHEDYSPRLYSTAHVRGNFDGLGRLIVVDAHYPIDGQRPTIKICKITNLNRDPDILEFLESPGPFIPGVTHRNTVLQYLKRMSDRATSTSEKLLYDLVHLIVKGNSAGSDVAELLMDSYKMSVRDEADKNFDANVQQISEAAIILKFRELLQQGNKMEALDWAIENKAWGHALFLAYKMDERTHNNVMLKFANSLAHNDPLQTLYQLMSGHVPQASTYCADKSWSDWRPHLAMILSNPTYKKELDRKAIITLGDSLGARGRIFAAQFCYLAADVEFSSYMPDSKLVLLGSSANQEFSKFATCRSIMLSLCYEYGLKLHRPNYSIPTFQFYKLLLAIRLVENDRAESALQYCELLAKEMTSGDGRSYEHGITGQVIELATHLKPFDPVIAMSGDPNNDPDWLTPLKSLYDQQANLRKDEDGGEPTSLNRGVSNSTLSEVGHDNLADVQYQGNQDGVNVMPVQTGYVNNGGGMGQYDMGQQPLPAHNMYGMPPSQPDMTMTPPDDQQQLFYHQPPPPGPPAYQYPPNHQQSKEYDGYRGISSMNEKPWENGKVTNLEQQVTQQPLLLQPPALQDPPGGGGVHTQPSAKPGFGYYKTLDDQLKPSEKREEEAKENKKDADRQRENKPNKKGDLEPQQNQTGWFGNILEKLSMRPKNQMRLPDDKNPSIVWDKEQNRWVNRDGEDEVKAEIKLPPKAADLNMPLMAPNNAPQHQQHHNQQQQAGTLNKYKLQKGKLKPRYVDVMGGGVTRGGGPTHQLDGLLPKMPELPLNTNLFVPAPVEGGENAPIDFITAGNPVVAPNNQIDSKQLSRSSSMSSLSQEVQYYMDKSGRPKTTVNNDRHNNTQGNSGEDDGRPPMMYNPASFST